MKFVLTLILALAWSVSAAVSPGGLSVDLNTGKVLAPTNFWTGNSFPLNVKQPPFNAYGDGIHDDTAAIQAALNSVTNGGTIFFPNGLYLVTSSLNATAGHGFRICGTGISDTQYNIQAAKIYGGERNYPLLDLSGSANINIDNITIQAADVGNGEPSCAILMSRLASNASAGLSKMDNIYVVGGTNCVIMAAAPEIDVWSKCKFRQGRLSSDSYVAHTFVNVNDATSRNIFSKFQTLGTGAGGNNFQTFISCVFDNTSTNNNSCCLLSEDYGSLKLDNCYTSSANATNIIQLGRNGVYGGEGLIITGLQQEVTTNMAFSGIAFKNTGSGKFRGVSIKDSIIGPVWSDTGTTITDLDFTGNRFFWYAPTVVGINLDSLWYGRILGEAFTGTNFFNSATNFTATIRTASYFNQFQNVVPTLPAGSLPHQVNEANFTTLTVTNLNFGATNAAPVSPGTVVRWFAITNAGQVYKLGGYQ